MDETKAKTILMKLAVGEKQNENWFFKQGCSHMELEEMVEKGLLIKKPKDPKNFMSDTCYQLTLQGREFAWK